MKSILSIQSSVTFGAVGNTMASAVLSKMGHHLARVDTVQLTAHPGHCVRAGHDVIRAGGSLDDNDFGILLRTITDLGFHQNVDAVMTGYIGQPAQVDMIAETIASLKTDIPDRVVMVDPAIGDHGRLYVDDAIAAGIEERLIPLADVITPNAYEYTRLKGLTDFTPEDIEAASHKVFARYPQLKGIAVTGCVGSDDAMICDYWIDQNGMTRHEATRLTHNTSGMAGGGDLFAALLMGCYLSSGEDANEQRWRKAFLEATTLSHDIINGADKAGAIDIDLDVLNAVLGARD